MAELRSYCHHVMDWKCFMTRHGGKCRIMMIGSLFNFGSAVRAMSNNKWKAGLHRVPAMKKERLSIAMFYNPDLNGDLYHYDEETGDLKFLRPFREHFWAEFANSINNLLLQKQVNCSFI
eukprot:TRINITY_DN6819_c0_g1_i1.p1 TRINITY_DN6819_c0_g1~~TRINITY_DN6819_c0_g1_i1.p1  ORF type:complete len:120 (+),score=7.96 TRINITY_DN6819_c0_g1_i1:97-456(+)